MARLRCEQPGGPEVPLKPDHLVGRSRVCQLVLPDDSVSAQHAALRWTRDGWQVRDLGSRNGTWLDGTRLAGGESRPLSAGARLVFGHADPAWCLVSDAPPAARAVAVDDPDRVVTGLADTLTLPGDDDPQLTLFRGPMEGWLAETTDTTWPVRDEDIVEIAGTRWLLHLPDPVARTAAHDRRPNLDELSWVFTVSADEEYVALRAEPETDLEARVHHYLLLTLARARLADDTGAEAERGWVHMHELCRMLRMTEQQVNLHIWRARKQLAQAGVTDGAGIVQRRSGTGLLRIGITNFEVWAAA